VARRYANLVADLNPLVDRVLLQQACLACTRRIATLDDLARVELVRAIAHDERRGAHCLDDVAIDHEIPECTHLPFGRLYSLDGADPSNKLLVQGRHLRRELRREFLMRSDDDVELLDRLLGDALEGIPDLVRLDVGPGDHRDTEDDRDGGERRAQLSDSEAPQGEGTHRRALSWSRTSSTDIAPWSATTRPSARNRTRSAYAAAPAS
jgi:hypothetical protein